MFYRCKIVHVYTKKQVLVWSLQLPEGSTGRARTRRIARIRDNFTCQMCLRNYINRPRKLHVHHLNGFCGIKSMKYDQLKDLHLLITLCVICHIKHHEYNGTGKIGKRGKGKKFANN